MPQMHLVIRQNLKQVINHRNVRHWKISCCKLKLLRVSSKNRRQIPQIQKLSNLLLNNNPAIGGIFFAIFLCEIIPADIAGVFLHNAYTRGEKTNHVIKIKNMFYRIGCL